MPASGSRPPGWLAALLLCRRRIDLLAALTFFWATTIAAIAVVGIVPDPDL